MKDQSRTEEKSGGIEQFLQRKEMSFPYQIILSLEKIIQSWEEKANSQDLFVRAKAERILAMIEENPELKKEELAEKDVQGKENIIKQLFSDAYPIDLDDTQAFAVAAPFSSQFIYKSRQFREAYQNAVYCDKAIEMFKENNPKLLNAFGFILKEVYQAEIGLMDIPFIFPALDKETGRGKYYKVHLACADYSTVVAREKSKEFAEGRFDQLMENYETPNQWLKLFPAANYIFKGVSLITLIDITEQETLNRIQNVLLKNSTLSGKAFSEIGQFASDYLETPNTRVGVLAFDKNLNILKAEQKFGLSILSNHGIIPKKKLLEKILREFDGGKKLIVIDKYSKDPEFLKIHKKLFEKNIPNLVLAPMHKGDRKIGIFEITMRKDHSFSAFYINKLYRLIPLFEIALDRSIENVNNQIQKIIKDNCTAIHPSVEWRFFEEAVKIYDNTIKGLESEQMSDIIFEDVMPLYGLSDIRNSSVQRAQCIKSDLVNQLNLAKLTLEKLNATENILIFKNLIFNIDLKIEQLESGISSSEDEDIYGFLNNEIDKLFHQLETDERFDAEPIAEYYKALDENLGILYDKRKKFDDSVMQINLEISRFLNKEQIKLQEIYPHYFDIYQTDGVDYNIYIGQSISPETPFFRFHLNNLRLWQLSSMCRVAALTHNLKKEMPMSLETAQLILVQNVPINIKFRYEEKRFDIDSAYNARYEIVKKRIDKATIAETGERLTQPGSIAVVYSNNSVLKEYLKYVQFLQGQGIVSEKVEILDLEELQGTDELKAIRIWVNEESKILNDEMFTEKVLEQIQVS